MSPTLSSGVAQLDEDRADVEHKTCLNLTVVCVSVCIGAGVTEGVRVDPGAGTGAGCMCVTSDFNL